MDHSGIAGYLRLRDLDPALCRSIVVFGEELTGKHNLDPIVACDVKQALCQFAIDMATRIATRQVMGEDGKDAAPA